MATSRTKECSRLKEKCNTAPSTPRSYLGRRRLPRMSIPGSPDRNFPEKPIASFRRPTISSSLHTSAVPDKPHYPPFITGLAKHPPPRKPPEKFSTLRQPRITYTSISSFNERPPRTPSSFAKFCSGKASSSGKSEWSSELKRKRKEVNEYIPRISSVPEIVLQEEKEPTREIEMEEVEIVSIASIEEHLLPEELPDPEPDLVEPKVLDVIIDSENPQTEDHLPPIIEQCEPSYSEEVAEVIYEDDKKDEEIKECSNESADVAVAEGPEEPQVEEGGDGERQDDEIEKTIVVESSDPEIETVLDEVLEQSSIVSAEIAEAVQKQEQELKKEEEEGKVETVTMKASTSQAEPEKQETVQTAEELPEKAKAEKVAVAAAAKKPEAVQGRKKEGAKSNDVIEETKTKLMGMRRNKVLALVGAFETVMQLHEPEA